MSPAGAPPLASHPSGEAGPGTKRTGGVSGTAAALEVAAAVAVVAVGGTSVEAGRRTRKSEADGGEAAVIVAAIQEAGVGAGMTGAGQSPPSVRATVALAAVATAVAADVDTAQRVRGRVRRPVAKTGTDETADPGKKAAKAQLEKPRVKYRGYW